MASCIKELSADTGLLVKKFRELKVGQEITYDELSKVINRDVRSLARSNVMSAINIVRREDGIVMATVRKEGYKRLDDVSIVKTADGSINRIHRETRRALRRLECVADPAKLDDATKVQYNARVAGLSALNEVTKSKSQEKLVKAVQKSQQVLPLADTLMEFMK